MFLSVKPKSWQRKSYALREKQRKSLSGIEK